MLSTFLATLLALQVAPAAPVSGPVESPPPPEQVLAVPQELRAAFRERVVDARRSPEQRLARLVEFVFDENGLGVEYQPDASLTVSEVYQARKANCLSSTFLILALAREAGLKAHGQQIDRVLSWGSTGEIVMQSMHANAIVEVERRRFVVDVNANDATSATDALRPVSDQQLLALYYGNRAMELMVAGRQSDAKPWLDEALRHAPLDPTLLNNAGVLSLRTGDSDAAEKYFLSAIEQAPELMSGLSNLVGFYRNRGDHARVAMWQSRADRALRKDPYYQYTLGRQLELAGNYADAAKQYRRAVELNRKEHQFHFGLARVYFSMGDSRGADRELSVAYKLSLGNARDRYGDKLAALRKRNL